MTDSKIINSLFDFTELRSKSNTATSELSSKQQDEQLNLAQNDNLIKAFKQLREKNKMQAKEILLLREELKVENIKNKQTSEMLEITFGTNLQQKQKISLLQREGQQLKKKIVIMKGSVERQDNLQNQLRFIKESAMGLKLSKNNLQEEHSKLLEISVEQKLNLQNQINRLTVIAQNKQKNIEQLQIQSFKYKETIIKLKNQIKKIDIHHEQQSFIKQWNTDNFQTQHLLEKIASLEKEITSLKNRIKKDKEKKIELEDRVIQLEECSGFNNVKAEVFEGEIQIYQKKCRKYEGKIVDLKQRIEKLNNEKLQVESFLGQSILRNEQVITKLKQLNNNQVNVLIKQFQNRLKMKNKEGKESLIDEISKKYHYDQKIQKNNQIQRSNQKFKSIERANSHSNVLSQTTQSNIRQNSVKKVSVQESNLTFGYRQYENDSMEMSFIQNRIRKDREVMERKIKEKNMYRHIEASSPLERNKLRGEYISSFIDKRY